MPAFLSTLFRFGRTARHRSVVHSLAELDEHTLQDIGLLRTDVYAALAEPFQRDPSRVLKALCCHWHTRLTAPCC
jgi:uncharacterized protein YjiS (DUF1127 family)